MAREAARRRRRRHASGQAAPRCALPQTGTTGLALVAVGSLGRRELPPFGDLDLVLVHDGRPEIASVADALWYPVWDTGLRLDHSVRSIADAVGVASTDVKAGLGLLDARLVAGDADLAARLRTATLASWRQAASRRSRSCVTSVAGGRGRSANSPSCSSRT